MLGMAELIWALMLAVVCSAREGEGADEAAPAAAAGRLEGGEHVETIIGVRYSVFRNWIVSGVGAEKEAFL